MISINVGIGALSIGLADLLFANKSRERRPVLGVRAEELEETASGL